MGEYFSLKVAALLHDPPDKSWDIKNHEERAKKLAEDLTSGTVLSGVARYIKDKRVRWADRFVSTVDRWILNILVGGEQYVHGVFPSKTNILKNIFYPSLSIRIYRPDNTNDFINDLKGILRNAKNNEGLFWHLLYAFYEVLWYKYNPRSAGVADTRIPTHTLFDHVYATATAINWGLKDDKPSGFYVIVDVPGVQSFISNSRKFRDLWFSSYFVSAAVWYAIRIFVEKLGPEVLLVPSARNNPFYYHWLISEVLKRVGKVDFITRLVKEACGYDLTSGFPRYAVIPATITLVMPPIEYLKKFIDNSLKSKEDLAKLIYKRFTEAWIIVWDEVVKYLVEEANKKDKKGEFFQGILNTLRMFEDEFRNKSPLGLRIIVQDVQEVARQGLEEYKIFDKITELAFNKLYRLKSIKMDPVAQYNVFDITYSVWKNDKAIGFPRVSKRGFDYCTLCGKLPAIVILPPEDRYEEEIGDKNLSVLLPPGERLCPICLVKRIATFGKPLNNILSRLLGKGLKPFNVSFPTLGDIASLDFKESIVKAFEVDGETRELLEEVKHIVSTLGSLPAGIKPWWRWQQKIFNKIDKLNVTDRDVILLFVVGDAEREYLRGEVRQNYVNLRNKLDKINRVLASIPLNRYYAIIRADVDNMGRLLKGELADGYGLDESTAKEFLKEYIIGATTLTEIIRKIVECKDSNDSKIISEFSRYNIPKDEAKRRIEKFREMYCQIIKEGKLYANIAYQVTLSRVLMVYAIRESEIVEEKDGFVIYSGGDDLLAVAPSSRAIEIITETRKLWSYGDRSYDIYGFLTKVSKYGDGNIIVPTVYPSGRSYSITFTHYMYPLHFVLPYSYEMLEKAKNTFLSNKDHYETACKAIKDNKISVTKDSVILSCIVRGAKEVYAIIPWRSYPHFVLKKPLNVGEIIEKIYEVYRLVDPMPWRNLDKASPRKLTMSLIYDWHENKEMLENSLLHNRNIACRILERLFERNVSNKKYTDDVKELVEKITSYFDNVILLKVNGEIERRFLISEFPVFLKVIRGGMRG